MSPGGNRLRGEDGVYYNHRVTAHYLCHVVWSVRDLARSLGFYRDLLGFAQAGWAFGGCAAALTGGRTHHVWVDHPEAVLSPIRPLVL